MKFKKRQNYEVRSAQWLLLEGCDWKWAERGLGGANLSVCHDLGISYMGVCILLKVTEVLHLWFMYFYLCMIYLNTI